MSRHLLAASIESAWAEHIQPDASFAPAQLSRGVHPTWLACFGSWPVLEKGRAMLPDRTLWFSVTAVVALHALSGCTQGLCHPPPLLHMFAPLRPLHEHNLQVRRSTALAHGTPKQHHAPAKRQSLEQSHTLELLRLSTPHMSSSLANRTLIKARALHSFHTRCAPWHWAYVSVFSRRTGYRAAKSSSFCYSC